MYITLTYSVVAVADRPKIHRKQGSIRVSGLAEQLKVPEGRRPRATGPAGLRQAPIGCGQQNGSAEGCDSE